VKEETLHNDVTNIVLCVVCTLERRDVLC